MTKHLPCRSRSLCVSSCPVINIGGGIALTRMIAEESNMQSLEDIYLGYCAKQSDNAHHVTIKAYEYQSKNIIEKGEMFKEACSSVPSTVVRDLFIQTSRSLCEVTAVQREYAAQLGLLATLQLLLNAPPISPEQMVICAYSGKILNLGITPRYSISSDSKMPFSSQIKKENVSLRLTRNVVGALSGAMLFGSTCVSIGLSLDACLSNRDVIEASLSLLLYEDIKASQISEAGEAALEDERGEQKLLSILSVLPVTVPVTVKVNMVFFTFVCVIHTILSFLLHQPS